MSTRSNRPGTARRADRPAAAASGSSPSATPAANAAARLQTLNSPQSGDSMRQRPRGGGCRSGRRQIRADVLRAVIRFFTHAVGPAHRRRSRPDLPRPGIVGVDDRKGGRRATGAFEEAVFGREVVLHRAVEVEMVLREVGEDGRVEPHSVDPLERQRVRGDLEDEIRSAGGERGLHHPHEVERFGRRVDGRRLAVRDPVQHRARQSGDAAGMAQHRIDGEHRCRLAVGAGHARQPQRLIRATVQPAAHQRQRPAAPLDLQPRGGEVRGRAVR